MAFELVEGGAPPLAAAGACYLCKSAPQAKWVRTLVMVDWEGEVVICESCGTEIGNVLGMLSPSQAKRIQTRVTNLESRVKELEPQAEDYKTLLALVSERMDVASRAVS